MMPATGGQYVLLRVAYGPLWSNALSVLLILILTVINYRATQGGASRWPLVWAWRSSHCFTCWRTRRFSTFLRSLRLPRRTAWERRLHSERWDPRIHFTQTRYRLFFARFGEVHPKFETPASAIAIKAVWAHTAGIDGDLRAGDQIQNVAGVSQSPVSLLSWDCEADETRVSVFALRACAANLPGLARYPGAHVSLVYLPQQCIPTALEPKPPSNVSLVP